MFKCLNRAIRHLSYRSRLSDTNYRSRLSDTLASKGVTEAVSRSGVFIPHLHELSVYLDVFQDTGDEKRAAIEASQALSEARKRRRSLGKKSHKGSGYRPPDPPGHSESPNKEAVEGWVTQQTEDIRNIVSHLVKHRGAPPSKEFIIAHAKPLNFSKADMEYAKAFAEKLVRKMEPKHNQNRPQWIPKTQLFPPVKGVKPEALIHFGNLNFNEPHELPWSAPVQASPSLDEHPHYVDQQWLESLSYAVNAPRVCGTIATPFGPLKVRNMLKREVDHPFRVRAMRLPPRFQPRNRSCAGNGKIKHQKMHKRRTGVQSTKNSRRRAHQNRL